MADAPSRTGRAELDPVEYLLLSAADVTRLVPVATAALSLARAGAVRLLDAVLLMRTEGQITVRATRPGDRLGLAELDDAVAGGVRLSQHDIELVALTLEPDESALLLLVEDRWAEALSVAVRDSGARLAAGERVARDRVAAALAAHVPAERHGRVDLLSRGPGTTPVLDQVEQVRQLARLVDRGVLPIEDYEVQRTRVLQG